MKPTKRTFLEQIFYGSFIPSDHIQPRDPEYLPTCDEAEKEYFHLCRLLKDDDRKRFKHLLDLNLHMSTMDSCASFTRGFEYGALLMLEIIDAKESLYSCP